MTKGNVESFVVKVASAFSGFIEEQKDKDLLDVSHPFSFFVNKTVQRSSSCLY